MRKCRDCSAKIDNRSVLCPACKAKAAERALMLKRESEKRRNLRKAGQPKPPHKCTTEGCDTMIGGRRKYCDDCVLERRNERNRAREPVQEKRPRQYTNMDGLDKFKGWEGSGMSYAEWQRLGR